MISVSDHALLRFLERVGGLDVAVLRSAIEQSLARAHGAALELGVADYLIHVDNCLYVVRNGVVTTILPEMAAPTRFAALAPRSAAE